jgi:hypothetical protein
MEDIIPCPFSRVIPAMISAFPANSIFHRQ